MSYKWNCVPMQCNPLEKGFLGKFFAIAGYNIHPKSTHSSRNQYYLLSSYAKVQQTPYAPQNAAHIHHRFQLTAKHSGRQISLGFLYTYWYMFLLCCEPSQRQCYQNITDFNFPQNLPGLFYFLPGQTSQRNPPLQSSMSSV